MMQRFIIPVVVVAALAMLSAIVSGASPTEVQGNPPLATDVQAVNGPIPGPAIVLWDAEVQRKGYGAGEDSGDSVRPQTPATDPGVATDVSVGPLNSGGTLQVNWTKAANATGYIVIAVNTGNVADVGATPVNGGDIETVNLSGLTVGATYDIYVVATAKGVLHSPTLPCRQPPRRPQLPMLRLCPGRLSQPRRRPFRPARSAATMTTTTMA